MKQQITVPAVGESVTQATVGEWQKKTGEYIRQNDVLVVMETDKASMELVAEHSGKLNILKQNGEDVTIGEVIGEVDTSATPSKSEAVTSEKISPNLKPHALKNQSAPLLNTVNSSPSPSHPKEDIPQFPSDKIIADLLNRQAKENMETSKKTLSNPFPTGVPSPAESLEKPLEKTSRGPMGQTLSPAVRKLVTEHNLNPAIIPRTGPSGRITKGDVLHFLSDQKHQQSTAVQSPSFVTTPTSLPSHTEETTRKKMTTIRKRIAERLVESQQSTATLTTFNEIDMSQVMSLRTQYKETFQKKHNIKLGFMGFFIKATVHALKAFQRVNAFIEDEEIVYNHFCHVGVAVSTDRGLVVPVIRNADKMELPELEKNVLFYAEKARDGKISPDDLMGGTFTISNGGVFGSLMSTPILNPPQSGILGMHKIEQRPVVVDGQITIKPMMYIALSYDHRMVDGKESVGFLLKIKECVEDPIRLLMNV